MSAGEHGMDDNKLCDHIPLLAHLRPQLESNYLS
jgi:hypothetical protein